MENPGNGDEVNGDEALGDDVAAEALGDDVAAEALGDDVAAGRNHLGVRDEAVDFGKAETVVGSRDEEDTTTSCI